MIDAMNIMEAIIILAEVLGVKKINELPGCWEHQIDASWWIAANGHREPMKCSKGPTVDPFTFYVEYNGWPAGVIDAGGAAFAAGSCANVETFVAAVKAATLQARLAVVFLVREGGIG